LSQANRLDQILIDISSSFIDASVDNVDEKIVNSLKMIGEFLELDRCSIGYLSDNNEEMLVTHVWNKIDIPSTQQSYQLKDFPWLLSPFSTGEQLIWHHSKGMPDGSESDLKLLVNSGMKGFAGIPVAVDGKLICCLGFSRVSCQDDWDMTTIDRFALIAGLFGQLMQRKRSDLLIHNALREISDLKDQLEKDNISLREKLKQFTDQAEIIGESDALQACLRDAEHVASENTTVLILGETGTGKELLAQAIHNMSSRKDRPMVKVNCAALPGNLIESELFGRERGAYTGAMAQQQGRFEIADGSTIFLDEIGDLPLDLQAKLLRVLQEGNFERLGSNKTIRVDVRIIAATNRDLSIAIKEGTFRKDLFYRLNVFPITMPPLSERREDIPLLIWKFVEYFNKSMGKSVKRIPDAELARLKHADWPGNIRELKNMVERSMIISHGSDLTVRHERKPSEQTTEIPDDLATLSDVERNHIIKTLQATHWRVSGEMGAAKILNIKPTTLEARMKKLSIVRPPK
jgi:transcriptional regulator with GAF, ATPase, and Fis domain